MTDLPKFRHASNFHRAIASNFERWAQNYVENFMTSVNEVFQAVYQWVKYTSDDLSQVKADKAEVDQEVD